MLMGDRHEDRGAECGHAPKRDVRVVDVNEGGHPMLESM